MSFEQKIPEHIKSVETQIKLLEGKLRDVDWGDDGHECDCDYCDRQGDGAKDGDPDAEAKTEILTKQIKEAEHLISSLKSHAAVHNFRHEKETGNEQ